MTQSATFSLFTRKLPRDRGFLVAAGLESALFYLEEFEVDDQDVAAFAAAVGCPVEELESFRGLRFTGEVWAVPEGRVVLPGEPLLEVTAPLHQAQLVETFLLNQITYQTALASKAVRCVLAARGKPVVDFSLRRTHGVEAGMHAARAGAIVGFAGTSNVAAAQTYGVPAVGTMAHSFIEVFPAEGDAFRSFARHTRGPVTLLVDTYDTVNGLHIAAEVLRELRDHRAFGVRLDSGDLNLLALSARRILDAAGLDKAAIIVSGGLDEYGIDGLVSAEAPIDLFAVGTKVGTAADQPFLDSAYKLVEYAGRPVMKLSTEKITAPAPKQVFRHRNCHDVLAVRDEECPPDAEPLLEHVMSHGRRLSSQTSAAEAVVAARQRFASDLAELPSASRLVHRPTVLSPEISDRLTQLTAEVRSHLGCPHSSWSFLR